MNAICRRCSSCCRPAPGAQLVSFVPLILIFGIFYFLVIAPMRKRQKKLQTDHRRPEARRPGGHQRRPLRRGGRDRRSGVILLKVADNVRLKVAKSAIAGLEQEEQEAKK